MVHIPPLATIRGGGCVGGGIMVSLKKYVPCKCGANNSFDFSSEMNVEDITVSARCPSCGASITVSISSMLAAPSSPSLPSVSSMGDPASAIAEEATEKQTKENVEQAVRDLFKY